MNPPFDVTLKRLREACDETQEGTPKDRRVVLLRDLKSLLHHFDKLNKERTENDAPGSL